MSYNYQIVVSLRDKVSNELNKIKTKINNIKNISIFAQLRLKGREALNSIKDRVVTIKAKIEGLGDIKDRLEQIKQKILALAPLLATLIVPLKQSMDFELQFIDVDKVFNGTKKELEGIKETIFKIAKDSSASVKDITSITAKGIGTGKIKLTEMEDFIKLANESKVAFSLSTNAVGGAMDTVLSKLGYNTKEMRQLFDMLNYSTNISSSKMGDMLNILKRTGGAMKQLKANQIATLINFGTEKGVSPETTASSLNTIVNRLKALNAVKMKKFNLDMGGLSGAKAFKQGEGFNYLLTVLKKIKKVTDADTQYKMITDIFGTGEQKNLIENFLNDMTGLEKRLKDISLKTNYADSVRKEFEKVEATSLKKIERLKGLFNILMITIGDNMLKAFSRVMDYINPLIERLVVWTKAHQPLVKIILKVLGAITLLIGTVLIFKGLMLAISLITGVVTGALSGLFGVVVAGLGAISLPLIAVGALIAGVIIYWKDFKLALSNAISAENLLFIKNTFSFIWNILKGVWDTVTGLFTSLKSHLFTTSTELGNTSTKVSILASIFGFLGSTIGIALNTAIGVIKTILSYLSRMYNKIAGIISKLANIKVPDIGKKLGKMSATVKHKVSGAWNKTKSFFGYNSSKSKDKSLQTPKTRDMLIKSPATSKQSIDVNFKGSGVRDIKVKSRRMDNLKVSNVATD